MVAKVSGNRGLNSRIRAKDSYSHNFARGTVLLWTHFKHKYKAELQPGQSRRVPDVWLSSTTTSTMAKHKVKSFQPEMTFWKQKRALQSHSLPRWDLAGQGGWPRGAVGACRGHSEQGDDTHSQGLHIKLYTQARNQHGNQTKLTPEVTAIDSLKPQLSMATLEIIPRQCAHQNTTAVCNVDVLSQWSQARLIRSLT